MSNVIRCALPGINAQTNTDPKNFSLFTDEDNVLIKEHSRGSTSASAGNTATITHNLGYYPHFYAYGLVSTGRYQIVNGHNLNGEWISSVTNSSLKVKNVLSAGNTIKYFIFHDDIPT